MLRRAVVRVFVLRRRYDNLVDKFEVRVDPLERLLRLMINN